MKKIAALILTLVLCLSVVATVAACTPKALPNFEIPEEGFDTETPVTIKFYHCAGQALESVLDDAIKDFKELYPNVTIEKQKLGQYKDLLDQIKKMIGTGQAPNLAYCYPDHVATYNAASGVVALDNIIKSDIKVKRADGTEETLGYTKEQLDDFVDTFYAETNDFEDGFTYLMPLSKSTEVMYYNKTYFDENNLNVPTHWFAKDASDDTSMEYVCKKILQISKDNGIQAVPFGYDSNDNWFITLAAQLGAGYTELNRTPSKRYVFDNAENRDIMAKFRQWYQDGYFTIKPLYGNVATGGSNTSGLLTNTTDAASPRAYMSIGSSGGASYNIPSKSPVFETGVAPVPQLDENNPKYILQGPDVCIFKKENPQEVLASWLFLKFLTTNIDFQAAYSQKSGYMPIIRSVDDDEIFQGFLANTEGNANLQARVVKLSVQLRDHCITSPAFNGSSAAREQVGKLFVNIISIETNDVPKLIDKAFKDAISECLYYSD